MLRMGKWRPMSEPINVDRPIDYSGNITIYSGVGPAASFADSYAKHYNEKVGLIPCADGGSSLEDWKVDGQLFLHALYQAKLAMNISELAASSGIRAKPSAKSLNARRPIVSAFLLS